MAVGVFYGREVFNPWLIAFQILLMQTVFYSGYVFVLLIADRVTASHANIVHQMFRYDFFNLHDTTGFVTCLGMFVSTIVFVTFGLVYIIGRAKKCLDFAGTLFLIHFLLCWVYYGFPARFLWWLVNATSMGAATLLSEFLCLRLELREIPLSGVPVELSSVTSQV
mmetsp:Transcript_23783/g.93571  ORF Transcript_23783/g.93571 Transcript_23783/m.93571 type:complete len:166 (-) Transcript_23783:184-681(-)